MEKLLVSVEQDDCTACGLCTEIVSSHFFTGEDGLAYVKESGPNTSNVVIFQHRAGKVAVEHGLEELVVEAAEDCPGECIYVEPA